MSYDENNDLVGGSDEFGEEEKEPNIDELGFVDDADTVDDFRFPGGDEEAY